MTDTAGKHAAGGIFSMLSPSFYESFPVSSRYRDFGMQRVGMVKESGGTGNDYLYSERHLQCVWFDSSLRPARLLTSDGEDVAVEDAGRWNLEAGPDFLDAILVVGPDRRRLVGDVEIHVRPRDWNDHRHSADPAYSRIVGHVAYYPGRLDAGVLPGGAVQISLRDALAANPTFSFENVDVTAYPYSALLARKRPCARLLASWSPDEQGVFLDAAGQERLRLKTCRMAQNIEARGAEQAFYEELMCALGYKHNRAPFRQLAHNVSCAAVKEECGGNALKAYSLLLGASGLLPARDQTRWDAETRAFIRRLWDEWWKMQAAWQNRCLTRDNWHLAGVRPLNHPIRRLAAASALFASGPSFMGELLRLGLDDPDAWLAGATAIFSRDAGMEYWKRRLTFATLPQECEIELLGAGRITAIVTNVVIPFLAARGHCVTKILPQMPSEEINSLAQQTACALFGRDHNPRLYNTGIRQQGLLQVFHDFCLSKTACDDCGLLPALGEGNG